MMTSSKKTLFLNESEGTYDLQTRFSFDEGNMEPAVPKHEIVSTPENAGETLHVKLFVQPGGNMPEACHEFSIGTFPSSIQQWELYLEVYDLNGTKLGEKRVAQEEGEAEPRPIGTETLG